MAAAVVSTLSSGLGSLKGFNFFEWLTGGARFGIGIPFTMGSSTIPLPPRKEGILEDTAPPLPFSFGGYEYTKKWEICPITRENCTPENVMGLLQQLPGRYFPFDIKDRDDPTRLPQIFLDTRLELYNVRYPGDKNNPVVVTQVTPTSFTFTTEDPHFDPAGSTITFSTEIWDGFVYLHQHGRATKAGVITSVVVSTFVGLAWMGQADKLNADAQFPVVLDEGRKFNDWKKAHGF
jgi:hypothetical protein